MTRLNVRITEEMHQNLPKRLQDYYIRLECEGCFTIFYYKESNYNKLVKKPRFCKTQCYVKCRKEYQKRYYHNNKVKISNQRKERYWKNIVERTEKRKEEYQRNKEKYKQYHEKNKEKIRIYNKKYYQKQKQRGLV